ncbi:MAG: hypothetical protein NT013_00490 [Planctomycetia bacterium]|nr:hypothetical protein [Planctomycetia bacterium]
MSQTTYRIRRWSEVFENSQSRQYQRLTWTPLPNKHDGKSFRRLISMADGPALYGAWVLLVQVASKCPQRGVLADQDGPLDAEDLSHKTGAPAELFAKAFEALTHPKIAWLEVVLPTVDQQHATSEPTVTLGNMPLQRTEQNDSETETEGFAEISKPDWPELDAFTRTETPQPADIDAESVWDALKTPEKLRDAQAVYRWHRWQLSMPRPAVGPERWWQVLALALGLKIANPKSTRAKNPKGVWVSAICKSRFVQARAFVPQAIELLTPVWADADHQGGQS